MIFISHTTTDDAFVDSLADELAIYGYQTWVDHKDMHAGVKWVAYLEKALAESNVLILVLSEDSVKSSYVEAEWHTFFNLKRTIIPIRIDNCEQPLFLQTFHQIAFTKPQAFRQNMQKLLEVLEATTGETCRNKALEPSGSMTPELSNLASESDEELLLLVETIIEELAPTLQSGNMMLVLPLQYEIIHLPKLEILHVGRSHHSLKHQPEIDLKHVNHNALISRQHATLLFQGEELFVQDLASTNGTFLKGVQLAPHEIYPVDNNSLLYFSKSVPLFLRYSFGSTV